MFKKCEGFPMLLFKY